MRQNRLWTAISAVVGLAALVVLASCQGPAGVDGSDGAMGIPGAAGPAGPPGTTDNAPPIVGTAIAPVYLTLNGPVYVAPAATAREDVVASMTGYKTKTVTLTTAFKDVDSPGGLSYTAVSTDPKIAKTNAATTTGAVTGSSLLITGVKEGKTTITVTAFDGVNKKGAPTTFDVTVVDVNTRPAVSVTRIIEDYTGIAKKLISDGALEIPFAAAIKPGVVGEDEKFTFRTVVESGLKADTAYVKAATKAGTVSGSYILTVTRIPTAIEDDASKENKITIFATDSFGAERMVDLNGPTGMASLVVEVNAPPRLARPLPTVYLYRSASPLPAATASNLGGVNASNTKFVIEEFFAGLEMTEIGVDGMEVSTGDTTCTFITNQPTGHRAVAAARADANGTPPTPAYPAVAKDLITAATKATVTNGSAAPAASNPVLTKAHHYPTSLAHTGEVGNDNANRARVEVNSRPATIPLVAATDTTSEKPAIDALGLGSFDLTITCRDAEKSVFSTATIEVLK